jgi:diguanylate cyclase (GGDEF)-like protein
MWLPLNLTVPTLDYLAATDRKARELEHQAYHDPLTGLENRAALRRHLEHAVGSDQRGKTGAALLMMDLDGFKEVNDTFGHQHGDALLREVALRLRECVGERGEVTRLGGDEFAVLVPDASGPVAEELAQDLRNALSTPLSADGVELFMAGSIGIAISPEDGTDAETLLRRADMAMYAAKKTRTGAARYSPGLDSNDRERLTLLHDFHLALTTGALSLAFQPKVCARTRSVHSVEALLRWRHPTHGWITPAVFIPLAEQAGLSGPIVRWVLDAALSQSRIWQEQGHDIPVCVNISMYDLRDSGFPDLVADRLAAHRVSAELLGIEVTESAAMADPDRTRAALERLRAKGVRVSIDDFGTGYSSLAYLVGLPVDELKIDRSFVVGMPYSAQHAAIVRTTISLGHDLHLTVVAEGVEDDLAWNRLKSFGCDLIQGYAAAPPLTAPELIQWLDETESAELARPSLAA